MKIAILGAGGVGGYYGGALASAGHHVSMLARGPHLEALRARGLEIRTPDGIFFANVAATGDPMELGKPDLAILSVKSYSLAEILPAVRLVAEKGATILPLLNGVEAVDRLASGGIAKERLLGGLTHISAVRIAPGVVERRSPLQKVTVGELDGCISGRVERIASAFREAGAEAVVSHEIVADLWRKLAFIASMAAACGLARAPLGRIRTAPLGPLLLSRAVHEVFAVARERGVVLLDDEEEKTLRFIDSIGDGTKPSFLLDLEASGPTELDDLCGAVSRLGREAGVPTPIHDTATAALGAATASRRPETR
ncbi:MAG: ketopantoate reductase family protein [Thermoanaerobaculia bacterium]